MFREIYPSHHGSIVTKNKDGRQKIGDPKFEEGVNPATISAKLC